METQRTTRMAFRSDWYDMICDAWCLFGLQWDLSFCLDSLSHPKCHLGATWAKPHHHQWAHHRLLGQGVGGWCGAPSAPNATGGVLGLGPGLSAAQHAHMVPLLKQEYLYK